MPFLLRSVLFGVLLLVLPSRGAATEGFSQTWDYSGAGGLPSVMGGLRLSVRGDVRTPDGRPVLECVPTDDRDAMEWTANLGYAVRSASLRDAGAVEIAFWIKGAPETRVLVRVSSPLAGTVRNTETRSYPLTGEWQRVAFKEPLRSGTIAGMWTDAPRLAFDGDVKGGQPILVGPLSLAATPAPDGAAASAPVPAPAGWKPLDTSSLYVKAGTALDLSPSFDPAPAGSYGRVIVNPRGDLAFAQRPDAPVRFLCVQLMPPPDLRRWSDQEIADFAAAVARQGYNLARIHFFDYFLQASDTKAPLKSPPSRYVLPEKADEIVFDPASLDRYQLLLAELKKHGVYWNIDWMTSFVGYDNGRLRDVPPHGGFNSKVEMFVNPNFRANWKAAVTRRLNDVNPYTGLSLKDDPALALTTCLNEQEILFESRNYGHELDGPWHAYLQKKYGDYAKLRDAWGGKCGDAPLPADGSIDGVPPIAAPTVLSDTPAGRDMAACCGRMEVEMTQWYLDALKELGFPGLASNWNMRTRVGSVPARSLLPVVTMNSYHAHPRFGPPVVVDQGSALAEAGTAFKNQTTARFLDRPFVNTELGIVFWNQFRHEQGLLFGAGAALQGWSGLNCHALPVVESGSPLLWFAAGDDPVVRASEVVEALAFRRGDVAASPHTIEIPLDDAFIQAGNGMKAIDDELSRLWPLCRVGISYGPKKWDFPAVFAIPPGKTSSIGGTIWFSSVAKSSSTDRLSAAVAKLREARALAPSNPTDPAQGLFQSDTGEVTLRTKSGGELLVRTPRLEGAVLKADKATSLDALTVEKCTVPASVTLASLDPAKGLCDAGRLLLVFATDARNSGMTFSDAGETTLAELGTLPVVVRTGEVRIALARSVPPRAAKAYALRLNGERAEEIPVAVSGATLSLDVDTAALAKAGPTPFFEIVLE